MLIWSSHVIAEPAPTVRLIANVSEALFAPRDFHDDDEAIGVAQSPVIATAAWFMPRSAPFRAEKFARVDVVTATGTCEFLLGSSCRRVQ
jgi:hypothetical protein